MSAEDSSVKIKMEPASPETATQVPGEDVASTTEINNTTDQTAPTPAEKPKIAVPKVGVTAVIQNAEGKFLCSIRKGSHGEGKCPLFFLPISSSRNSIACSSLPWNGIESVYLRVFC